MTRAVSLLYHDVVEGGRFDASGRPGNTARRYKLTLPLFEAHLLAIAQHARVRPTTVLEGMVPEGAALDGTAIETIPRARGASGASVFLTFDDGGSSAYTHVAGRLEELGWHGHFFVTTGEIGAPGFLTPDQIRELHVRGHVVGSHSCSHPERMTHLEWPELVKEWRDSVAALEEILGDRVVVGSVPGGYYSSRVARAASEAGITALFTSEPTTSVRHVAGCRVFGRLSLHGDSPASLAGRFASFDRSVRARLWLQWNIKKALKLIGGRQYIWMSEQVFRLKEGARR